MPLNQNQIGFFNSPVLRYSEMALIWANSFRGTLLILSIRRLIASSLSFFFKFKFELKVKIPPEVS